MVNAFRNKDNKARAKRNTEIGDRDGWVCHICLAPVDRDLPWDHPMHASVDHLIPRWADGTEDPSNLKMSHHKCNHERDAAARALAKK